jgi:hypothetical protein
MATLAVCGAYPQPAPAISLFEIPLLPVKFLKNILDDILKLNPISNNKSQTSTPTKDEPAAADPAAENPAQDAPAAEDPAQDAPAAADTSAVVDPSVDAPNEADSPAS